MTARTKTELNRPLPSQSQRTTRSRTTSMIANTSESGKCKSENNDDDDDNGGSSAVIKGRKSRAKRKGNNNNTHKINKEMSSNTTKCMEQRRRKRPLCKLKPRKRKKPITQLTDALLLEIFTFANTGFNQKQIVDMSGLSRALVSKIFKEYWESCSQTITQKDYSISSFSLTEQSSSSSTTVDEIEIDKQVQITAAISSSSSSSASRKPALRSCYYRQDLEQKKSVRFLDVSV